MFLTATDTSKTYAPGKEQLPMGKPLKINLRDIPEWVRRQRYSWHGVDHMYHDFYRQYLEVLLASMKNIEAGLDKSTMVIYMGDNGFSFGEHGLIDKRHMYQESMRVPGNVIHKSVTTKANYLAQQRVTSIIGNAFCRHQLFLAYAPIHINTFLTIVCGH